MFSKRGHRDRIPANKSKVVKIKNKNTKNRRVTVPYAVFNEAVTSALVTKTTDDTRPTSKGILRRRSSTEVPQSHFKSVSEYYGKVQAQKPGNASIFKEINTRFNITNSKATRNRFCELLGTLKNLRDTCAQTLTNSKNTINKLVGDVNQNIVRVAQSKLVVDDDVQAFQPLSYTVPAEHWITNTPTNRPFLPVIQLTKYKPFIRTKHDSPEPLLYTSIEPVDDSLHLDESLLMPNFPDLCDPSPLKFYPMRFYNVDS